MARKVRVVLDSRGCAEVMNGDGVMGEVESISDSICAKANAIGHGTYVSDVRPGRNRCHGRVRTDDVVARVDNFRRNILLKSMRGSK